jgi:uncharacterized membrane protein
MNDFNTYKPLGLLILLGIVLRFVTLPSYGIWHDERVSILIAHGLHHTVPVNGIVSASAMHSENTLPSVVDATILDNGNGLLYNVLLHYWMNLFGNSDLAARLLSFLFSVLLIPLVHAFSQKLFNSKRIAIAAAFITVIHPLFVAYAQQARPYAMATFFTLLASTMFIDIIRERATFRTYIWYALAASCALLTHYLAAYIFIAHALIFLTAVRSSKAYVHYFLSGSLVALVFVTWMINGGLEGMKVLDMQNAKYAIQASNYVEGQKSFAMPASPKNIVTGWVQVWLQVFGNRYQNFGFRIREIAAMVLIPLVMTGALGWMIRKDKGALGKYRLIVILIVVQTVFASILAIRSGHCISFQTLYASFVVPYACVLLGWTFVHLYESNKFSALSIALSVFVSGVMLSSCFTTYLNTNSIFPDFNGHRRKAQELSARSGDEPVAIKTGMDLMLISLYLPDETDILLYVDATLVDDSYSVERNP